MQTKEMAIVGLCICIGISLIVISTGLIPGLALLTDIRVNPQTYDLSVNFGLMEKQISRWQLMNRYSIESKPSSFSTFSFNISQFRLNVNITGNNSQGQTYFYVGLVFDTLADQKIQLFRQYDPALKTSIIIVYLDAKLHVEFNDGTLPIDKEFHFQRQITLGQSS